MGELRAIWIKQMSRGPMDKEISGRLVENQGLENNADQGGKRQITLMEEEVWTELMDQFNEKLSPATRRANLMLKGIRLAHSKGKTLQVGPCQIKIYGETTPCYRMDEALPGLKNALKEHWRGGAYGVVLNSGEIQEGDSVSWVKNEEMP
ncbi:sulfurase [Salipaludibacillus keqinensis]|uniref:Sulfurase n=1 Tax=Salipaludibacillus keqinensis TaxID=2045207 RepID=A0A323TMB1_9BACI|nr:MOSC domain-containing protein [Salipaludibacillus keqinensis]PYZ95176.1 sulfurase [Salipaludibacillus keqinensis]